MADIQETQPSSSLSAEQLRRSLRISIFEGSFATIYGTLAGGMFLTGLALYLHANSFQIGLLSAIPSLVSGFGFLSGYLVGKIGSRKKIVITSSLLGRILYAVLVPFLLLNIPISLKLFFVIVALTGILGTITGTVWNSWMSELVPEDRRGRFFGTRNAVLGVIGVVTAFSAGRAMDALKARGHEQLGYGLAFSLATVFGLISTLALSRQPEPPLSTRPALSLRRLLLGPLKEPQFRRLITFQAVYSLTGTLASPFYMVHLFRNLHFPFAAVGVYSVLGGLTGMVFQLFWGRVIDRFGARPVTILGFSLVGIMPWLWLFATPSFRLPIWLDGISNGIIWSCAHLGLWNLLLELADDPQHKESYFAIYTVVAGLCAFAASTISGIIAQALRGFHITLFGREFVNYHVLFLAAGTARFASLPLLIRVQQRSSRSVRYTVRVLSQWAIWRINSGRDAFLEALRLKEREE